MIVRCIISDLDGTLVSSARANFAAYRDALAERGHVLAPEAYAKAFGLRADDMLRRVASGLSAEDLTWIKARKVELYPRYFHLLEENQSLLQFLRVMRPSMRLGVATTARRVNAEGLLRHVNAQDLFDHCVFGEDVSHGKPDPECYRLCMQRCGVTPDECLIFEDSEIGIAAAKAAGARVVVVPATAFGQRARTSDSAAGAAAGTG
jgi:HAD superfamily hydrolase (TIGR01509 family)